MNTQWKISQDYLRNAFSFIAQLDMAEEVVSGKLKFKGGGNHVLVSHEDHGTFTMNENALGEIYVHDWRFDERTIELDKNFFVKTHWVEVYRSGVFCEKEPILRLIEILKLIVGGDVPCPSKAKPKGDSYSRPSTKTRRQRPVASKGKSTRKRPSRKVSPASPPPKSKARKNPKK